MKVKIVSKFTITLARCIQANGIYFYKPSTQLGMVIIEEKMENDATLSYNAIIGLI